MRREEYTWEWVATKIDPELIPLAKKFVQRPGSSVYWNRTFANGQEISSERGNFEELCRYFDPQFVGEKYANERDNCNLQLMSMAIDALRSRENDTLKAVAMVEDGCWSELPDIYNDVEDLTVLVDRGFLVHRDGKYHLTSKTLLDWCVARGKFTWGKGKYKPKNDHNQPEFYTSRQMEMPANLRGLK